VISYRNCLCSTLGILVLCASGSAQTPVIQGAVNSASFQPKLAPGTWSAIFGAQLAPSTLAAPSTPFPSELNGISVTFGGKAAPLSFVSPGQINALIPFDAATLTGSQTAAIAVVVTTPTGVSQPFNITLQRTAPAIYTKDSTGSGPALAFGADFSPITTIDGSPIVLYATGLGPVSPDVKTNETTSLSTLSRVVESLSASVGLSAADIIFAGLAPGLQGIYQINLKPKAPFLGDNVSLTAGLYSAPALTLPVPQGRNVANVTGTIDGLYPATGDTLRFSGGISTSGDIGMSMLLQAATFSVTFDILPNAAPFSVVAIAGDFRETLHIDPAARTFTGFYVVPYEPTRVFNFSGFPDIVYDFVAGRPFPGNIVPLSHIDRWAGYVLSRFLTSNQPPSGVNVLNLAGGDIPADGNLTITGYFGGFRNFPRTASGSTFPVNFGLYVDSKSIASGSAAVKFR
jgi:uncharacterized protein (TIGR03437 family)